MVQRFMLEDDFIIGTDPEDEEEEREQVPNPIAEDYLADSREAIAALSGMAEAPGTVTPNADDPPTQASGDTPPPESPMPVAEMPDQGADLPEEEGPTPEAVEMSAPRRQPVQLPEMAIGGERDQSQPLVENTIRQTSTKPRPGGDAEVDDLLADVDRRRRLARVGGTLRRVFSSLAGQQGRVDPAENAGVDPAERRALRAEMQRGAQQRQEQAQTEEQSDPNSDTNRRWRAVLAERLPGVQIPETLTQADTATRGLLEGLVVARDREQQARVAAQARGEEARALEGVRSEGREELQRERLEGQQTLQNDRQAFQGEQNEANRALAQQRLDLLRQRVNRRGRGGGGGGGAAAGLSAQEQEQAFVDMQVSRGATEDTARNAYRMLDRIGRRTAVNAALAGETINTRGAVAQERREHLRTTQHEIPGWTRRDDAPELGQEERTRARQTIAEASRVRTLSQRLGQLSREIPAMERAGAAGNVLSARMAEARGLHEQLTNSLRVVGNYGVPQAGELARMERLAPSLDSVAGWASASNVYSTLPGTIDRGLAAYMDGYGYTRGSAPAQGGGDRIRIRLANGQTGRWPAGQALPAGATRVE